MNITPNKLTIAQLFATSNEQFIVPSYQRQYAWKKPQYHALFEDIDILKENDGHLLGMIILHSDLHTGGLNKPELVDGQQRLTTLVILLKAIESVFKSNAKLEKAQDIRKMIICKDSSDKEYTKIQLGDLDNQDIYNLILIENHQDFRNKNIKDAYDYFIDRLQAFDIDSLNKFFFKLTNVAVLIRLDVGLAQDAYKLFETINNRGLKLTPTDIIKNFLLGHAAKINEPNTLERVKTLWSSIISNLENLDTDDFLRQFMCATLHRKITMSKLVFEFKRYYLANIDKAELLGEYQYYQEDTFDNENETEQELIENDEGTQLLSEVNQDKISIIDFLDMLNQQAKMYKEISFALFPEVKINRSLSNLNNIRSKPSYIFLMKFLLSDKYHQSDKLSVLKLIETLMLRRHICEKRTSENDDIFSKMVIFIGEINIYEKILEFLTEHSYIPEDSVFKSSLPKHQFKGNLINRAKYMLEAIELFKRGNTNELQIASMKEVHLEHIIPQTVNTKKAKDEFGDWTEYLTGYSPTTHKQYVDNIGNMTLLGEALNIQASNNPFSRKKKSYKQSALLITKEIAEYGEFKFKQVDKRGIELAEIALKIWKF